MGQCCYKRGLDIFVRSDRVVGGSQSFVHGADLILPGFMSPVLCLAQSRNSVRQEIRSCQKCDWRPCVGLSSRGSLRRECWAFGVQVIVSGRPFGRRVRVPGYVIVKTCGSLTVFVAPTADGGLCAVVTFVIGSWWLQAGVWIPLLFRTLFVKVRYVHYKIVS